MLRSMKPSAQAPYIHSVGFAVIVAFTTCQLLYMLGVYGITWAGVSSFSHFAALTLFTESRAAIAVCLHGARLESPMCFMCAH